MKKQILLLSVLLLGVTHITQAARYSRFSSGFGTRARDAWQRASTKLGEQYGAFKTRLSTFKINLTKPEAQWKRLLFGCAVGTGVTSAVSNQFSRDQDKNKFMPSLFVKKAFAQAHIDTAASEKPSTQEWYNEQDSNGNTYLHRYIKSHDVDGVARMINYGADLTIQDKNGNTPLMLAVREEDRNIINLLLSQPNVATFINTKNKWGETPLIHAIEFFLSGKNKKIIKLLIEKGADVDSPTNINTPLGDYYNGRSAFQIALLSNNPDLIETIKEAALAKKGKMFESLD